MPVTVSKNSIELISRLFRNEFHAIPNQAWRADEMYQLIHTAAELQLNDLVIELVEVLPDEYKIEIKKQIKNLMLLKTA